MQAHRREFLTWSAGGAFMLAINDAALAQQAPAAPAARGAVSPWFKIGQNGRLTILSNAVEMGQGSHTGHASILADELHIPFGNVDVEMADAATYSGTIFTGGSRSISTTFDTARKAGAQARDQFMQAAAKQWNVNVTDVDTVDGKVINRATKAALSYGDLAAAAATMPARDQVASRDPATRTCIGKPIPTFRVKQRVTGEEKYGMDVRVPGMLRAAVIQNPTFGVYAAGEKSRLISVDEAPAMAIPGVKKVIKLDNAVAVLATDTYTAIKASRALKPVFSTPQTPAETKVYREKLTAANKAAIAAAPAAAANANAQALAQVENAKALRTAYDGAAKKVEASYDLTRVHHVTMEPQNCTVQVGADKIEIWGPTQVPTSVVRGAAGWAGKPTGWTTPGDGKVKLNITMLGGGFGRRLATDYVEQAVRIAAQADGVPVQMVWTREEDFTHDTYRTAVHQTYRAGLRADGLIDGYETITSSADTSIRGGMGPAPYKTDIKHAVTTAPAVATGVTFGPWRSVDEGISTWGRESFIDECAIAAGIDPLEYRLKLLGDDSNGRRAKRLLEEVANRIGWKSPKGAGIGRGIAVGTGFGSLAAHAVEVEVKGDKLTVKKIVVAGDIGTIVAPAQVRAQFEGGTLMALGTALSEGITLAGGKVEQPNFFAYQVLRHNQSPPVEVILFESPTERIGGSGEPPVPTLAPALANAIFNASKKRVRSLPINKQGFTV